VTGLALADLAIYLQGVVPGVDVQRGLSSDPVALTEFIGKGMIVTRSGGIGLTKEGVFDQPMVTVRCVGDQNDYDSAEALADLVDAALNKGSAFSVGSKRCLYGVRAGGGPVHITTDQSRRAHFQCSYVLPVASGL
jgi:hypothetical protein